ncbi:MAG TPA: hypothetical protein VN028_03680 [Rhodocyclaceae bacterium]|nr:hypothetical protein [Rhodocyclaceae bacterium]
MKIYTRFIHPALPDDSSQSVPAYIRPSVAQALRRKMGLSEPATDAPAAADIELRRLS